MNSANSDLGMEALVNAANQLLQQLEVLENIFGEKIRELLGQFEDQVIKQLKIFTTQLLEQIRIKSTLDITEYKSSLEQCRTLEDLETYIHKLNGENLVDDSLKDFLKWLADIVLNLAAIKTAPLGVIRRPFPRPPRWRRR